MDDLKIFIVEDNEWYSEYLKYNLSLNPDYNVTTFLSGKDCVKQLNLNPDIITLDINLPDMQGQEVMKRIKSFNPTIPIIIISGQEDLSTALNLLKNGAYEYIIKDDNTKDVLWNSVQKIRENKSLKAEINHLKDELEIKHAFSNTILGNSNAIKSTYKLIEKAISNNINVSITGETGTGKELVAKAIHFNSNRNKKPFIAINMSAIPKELIESELFGHEKGAFTGAENRKKGKFEEAGSGTIFLDEIAELDINLQSKLLRVLQEREVTRIGGNETIKIDCRIITATHKNLIDEVENKNFREDLYYRVIGLPIHLAPLRERSQDILILTKHFIELFSKENKLSKPTLSEKAKSKLLNYPYPGNIRELKSIIDLACVMCENKTINDTDITFNSVNTSCYLNSSKKTMKEYTIEIIQHHLKENNFNVVLTAKKLDIGKSTIYNLIKEKLLTTE